MTLPTSVSMDVEKCVTVFFLLAGENILPVVPGQFLKTVADTQNGHVELEDGGVDVGCNFFVDREWTARQDHTLGLPWQLCDLLGTRKHFRVDIEFTETSGDQMRVLGSEKEALSVFLCGSFSEYISFD